MPSGAMKAVGFIAAAAYAAHGSGVPTAPAPAQEPVRRRLQAPSGKPGPREGDTGSPGSAEACTDPPCAAPLLNDVGKTTVAGTVGSISLPVGENIYGPFEAGFGAQQENIMKGFGCTDANVQDAYSAGGLDTHNAEAKMAAACGVLLPRTEDGNHIGLLDECGGHHTDYHFHESLSCLYSTETGSQHSTKVGVGNDGKFLYGKWEDFSTSTLPKLDACGGHFGVTPDSNGKRVYHYHVQDNPPFTFGCYGPVKKDDTPTYKMVTIEECKALYTGNDGCGGDDVNTEITQLNKLFDLWCPCYDADGNNNLQTGQTEFTNLAAFTTGDASDTECTGADCVSLYDGSAITGDDDEDDDGDSGSPDDDGDSGSPGGEDGPDTDEDDDEDSGPDDDGDSGSPGGEDGPDTGSDESGSPSGGDGATGSEDLGAIAGAVRSQVLAAVGIVFAATAACSF